METKTESGKPRMNRTRRQLLLGAGLAPAVLSLQGAKVFGQSVDSFSGNTRFSGYIEGSLNANGTPGNKGTELTLYKAIHENPVLGNYYGQIGSGNTTYPCSWEYGTEGTGGEDTPRTWTKGYETPFVDAVEAYQDAVSDAITAINDAIGAATPLVSVPTISITDPITLLLEGYSRIGVFVFVEDAVASIKTAYNKAVDDYNTHFSENPPVIP